MSVRRLADDAVQPEGFKFNRAMAAEAKVWIKKYPKGREQSAVIPLLMLAQDQEGWVTKPAIEHIAEMLGMPLIRVMEVATFYTQFMLQPVGTRAHVQVCGTTPCMLRGANELKKVCQSKIGEQQFHRNESGTLSWEEVECQGACVNAPMVMIGHDTYEDLTPERLAEIIDAFEAGKGDAIKPGPQIDRIYSAPVTGLSTLTGDATGGGKKVTAQKAGAQNPTMKLATTASKSAAASAKLKKSDSSVAARLSSLEPAESAASVSPRKNGKSTASSKAAFGADPGSVMENVKGARAVKPKAKPVEKSVGKSNATMNIASTVSGRAKAPEKAEAKPGPVRLSAPDGTADDLKMISGVGPKLEKTLNSLGFWHFHQLAKWTKKDIAVVDDELSFKGRIERDDWVKQAKALAKGGRDEYVKVFGKEPR